MVDGHFCLQGDNGVIEIPLTTFEKMRLSAIVLLTDDPDQIHARLHSRDNASLGVNIIQSLQDKEKERANYVAKNLGIPLLESKINDPRAIVSLLASVTQL